MSMNSVKKSERERERERFNLPVEDIETLLNVWNFHLTTKTKTKNKKEIEISNFPLEVVEKFNSLL